MIINESDSILFFFDESRFGTKTTLQRVWAKAGEKLEIKIKQGYENFYVYSAVAPFTGEDFTLFLPKLNTKVMNIYLREFVKKYNNQRILMIMDNASWHKSKGLIVPKNIQIEHLPKYSPELNPVERLWEWLKGETYHNERFDDLEKLMDAIQEEYLKITPERFMSLCNCPYL